MSDVKCARMLLEAAERDVVVLRVLRTSNEVSDQVLGFHVQQGAEKALKAWIAVIGEMYPLSHNIGVLVEFLADRGVEMEPFHDLIGYTPYAVEFLYHGVASGVGRIDRGGAVALVEALLDEVREKLVRVEGE